MIYRDHQESSDSFFFGFSFLHQRMMNCVAPSEGEISYEGNKGTSGFLFNSLPLN
jgi:hypothetical protein